MEILRVEDLTFTYPACTSPALSSLRLSIEEGEFTVICGATGSGKSTLLRLLKRELCPRGEKSGQVYYQNRPIETLSSEESAASVGFVMQNPDHQIVTDTVWHELAFGAENLRLPRDAIAARIAETASYFGIEQWYDRPVSTLSGGQKQLLSLAAVMVMAPSVLILDEPTAQLDPIAASEFIATVHKLCRDFSITVLLVEHRLEELIPLCDRLIVLEKGSVFADGAPREVISRLRGREELLLAMPAAARLYHLLQGAGECPLTVREGREFLACRAECAKPPLPLSTDRRSPQIALDFREVYFRYTRDSADVLRGLDLSVYENEIFCLLGGNGSGKTTALSVAAGLLRPYAGKVRVFGKPLKEYRGGELYRECIALLPQDVQTVFLKNTVREELADAKAVLDTLPYDLTDLLEKHPYDLSGGEQQLVALAKVLAAKPRLLLIDEPTKGLDAAKKREFVGILRALRERGVTVVAVTHDLEFAAVAADRCGLFFRGQVVSADAPDRFFSQNRFYTTAASRIASGYLERAVTVEAIAERCLPASVDGGRMPSC